MSEEGSSAGGILISIWNPSTPSNKISGVLYREESTWLIKLTQSLDAGGTPLNNLNSKRYIELAIGKDEEGQPCSFVHLNLRVTNLNVENGLVGGYCVYRVGLLIRGDHIASLSSPIASKVSIYAKNLEKWVDHRPFQLDHEQRKLNYSAGVISSHTVTALNAKIEFQNSISASGSLSADVATIISSVAAQLHFEEIKSVDEVCKIAYSLMDLVTLLVGADCPIDHLRFYKDINSDKCFALLPSRFYETKSDIDSHKIRIGLSILDSNLEKVLDSWFKLHADKVIASKIAVDDISRPGPFDQFQYLAICQALEVFRAHEIDHVQKSFKTLLGDLLKRVDSKKIMIVLQDEFCEKASDSRNYYTHYNPKYQPNNDAGAWDKYELFLPTERLRIIFLMALLHDLGFDTKQSLNHFQRGFFTEQLFDNKLQRKFKSVTLDSE